MSYKISSAGHEENPTIQINIYQPKTLQSGGKFGMPVTQGRKTYVQSTFPLVSKHKWLYGVQIFSQGEWVHSVNHYDWSSY